MSTCTPQRDGASNRDVTFRTSSVRKPRQSASKPVSASDCYNVSMHTPQAGIFALGTSSHTYLEFDCLKTTQSAGFAAALAAIHEPRTTTGGVNFVVGLRPELWRVMAPQDAPAEA